MNKLIRKSRKKGFTLIELIVVIAILAILAAILVPVVGGFIDDANVAADTANAKNVFNCVQIYLAAGGTATTQAAILADADFIKIYGASAWPAAKSSTTACTVTVSGGAVTSVALGKVTIGAGGSVSVA